MSEKISTDELKLYFGINKTKAKLITLKQLMTHVLDIDADIVEDRFSDDSASWLDIRQHTKEGAIDVHITFDPKNDNVIEGINVYQSKLILDEENMQRII
tara:strand:+ start:4540 stop:4839 length:300 start_codon:yes stop_codon:yes gene_type:complete